MYKAQQSRFFHRGPTPGFATVIVLVMIFMIAPAQAQFKQLYIFSGGADGYRPSSPLVRDSQGNLYGTTAGGGTSGVGWLSQSLRGARTLFLQDDVQHRWKPPLPSSNLEEQMG